MKCFLTIHALGNGKIREVEMEPVVGNPEYVADPKGFLFKLNRDVFTSREDAVAYVRDVMVPKKIAALQAQINFLNKIELELK